MTNCSSKATWRCSYYLRRSLWL